MLKAIIFDYGKVLSLPPADADWTRFAGFFGVPVEQFQKPYWGLRDKYDRAELNATTYWQAVAEQLGKPVANGGIQRLVALDNAQWTKENPAMLEFAWRAQDAGLKIGILSNMQHDMLAAMRSKFPWLSRFDAQIYTCEVGVIKPEADSYKKALDSVSTPAAQTLFLDDKRVNIDGARAVGMHAELFTGDVDIAYAAVARLGVQLEAENTAP